MLNKIGPDPGPDLTECYIGHDLGTITSEFLPATHSYFMRNIIPKGSWAQNSPGTSRSAAFCIGAL